MYEKIRKIALLKYTNSKSLKEQEKYKIINNILKDIECFKKMSTKTAYNILYDLDFSEQEIKKIYNELIFSEH